MLQMYLKVLVPKNYSSGVVFKNTPDSSLINLYKKQTHLKIGITLVLNS